MLSGNTDLEYVDLSNSQVAEIDSDAFQRGILNIFWAKSIWKTCQITVHMYQKVTYKFDFYGYKFLKRNIFLSFYLTPCRLVVAHLSHKIFIINRQWWVDPKMRKNDFLGI